MAAPAHRTIAMTAINNLNNRDLTLGCFMMPNAKVSDGGQPPVVWPWTQKVTAGRRSLDRWVGRCAYDATGSVHGPGRV
jgi:hypothetical protein